MSGFLPNSFRATWARKERVIPMNLLVDLACLHLSIDSAELLGKYRGREVSWVRQIIMRVGVESGRSYRSAAQGVGRLDHTTAHYACTIADDLAEREPDLKLLLKLLRDSAKRYAADQWYRKAITPKLIKPMSEWQSASEGAASPDGAATRHSYAAVSAGEPKIRGDEIERRRREVAEARRNRENDLLELEQRKYGLAKRGLPLSGMVA